MVNGIDSIFIERNGIIEETSLAFDDVTQLEELIRRLSAKMHKEINELNPIVDFRLSDGSRVNAVYGNICLNGPVLTIRKFPKTDITMDQLVKLGTITETAANYLKTLVENRNNIFISGGTSSGKTTFLNYLSNYIGQNERSESTRLNSSHRSISYAVFCLKKKKLHLIMERSLNRN